MPDKMYPIDLSEPGDIGGNPRKSCLFFLTVSAALKWDYPELRPNGRKSTSPYEVSGAFSTILEKPGKRFIARQRAWIASADERSTTP
jgi:hypothetical protein